MTLGSGGSSVVGESSYPIWVFLNLSVDFTLSVIYLRNLLMGLFDLFIWVNFSALMMFWVCLYDCWGFF